MAEKKLTIFQRLNKIFGPEGIKVPQEKTNRYRIGKEEILKTTSKQEYETAKRQAQQNRYVSQLWQKVDGEMYQQSIHYEVTRIGSYTDFESMEFFPEIAAALDIFMEESTTPNERGKILNIFSESKRIKGVLEDLFFNRLDIHTNLPAWTRNLCKYGDNFVFMNIDDKAGVIGARQMPNFEMERREGDLYNMLLARSRVMVNADGNPKTEYDNRIKFFWKTKDVEFNSWQIAHFRLLGDDRKLPYGTSVLEKARRIWKQLLLSEDAMLIYRVTRAPERRIYKIYVGNIDDQDVAAYVNEIASRFKRLPVVDPATGQIDLRYNQLAQDQDYFIPVREEGAASPIDTLPGACIALDTKIPLLDGRTLELNEIINEWDNGNRNLWVYSCDPKTGSLAPGLITWAGETRKNAEVLKITLDNGKEIIATPDHKFVHRTKGFVEAKDLNVGESLMPFYRDKVKIKSNTNGDYERVWDATKNEWVFTHRFITESLCNTGEIKEFTFDEKYVDSKKNIRHHKDCNRFNNNPDNIVLMSGGDHMRFHQSVILKTIWGNPILNKIKISKGLTNFINSLTDDEKNERYSKNINKSTVKAKTTKKLLEWNSNEDNLISKGKLISAAKSTPEFKKSFSKIASEQWNSEEYRNKVFSKSQKIIFSDKLYSMFTNEFKKHNRADLTLNVLNNNKSFMDEFKLTNSVIRSSMTNLSSFTRNHLEKMVKEKGFKNFNDFKKNIICNYNHKIVKIEWLNKMQNTGTITVDGDEKYHNYHTFATESGVYIKNSNLSEIADIEYLQNKLFTALRIPKPFLGFDSAVGDGKNLALMDIRFSRTVNRIQQAILMELNKIAIVHLYVLGFEDELDNFILTLNNPSTQAEMLKIEHLQQKITAYKDAVSDAGNGFAAMSMTRGKKDILGMSDEEIKQDLLEQRIEKAAAAELAKTAAIIKKTGFFDTVDNIYGDPKVMEKIAAGEDVGGGEEGEEGAAPSGGGGGFGGGAIGGEGFGEEGETGAESETGGAAGGAAGGFGEEEVGGAAGGTETEESAPVGGESTTPTFGESIKKTERLLLEQKKLLDEKLRAKSTKYQSVYLDRLINSKNPMDSQIKEYTTKMTDKSVKINDNISNMIDDINKKLKEI